MESYRIKHIPTLVLLRPDGVEIDRIIDLPGYSRARYLDFLEYSFKGKDTHTKIREAYEKDPDNIRLAYRLFMKNIQRGDLEGTVSVGKGILERADLSENIKTSEIDRRGRNSIFEDTRIRIRTTLNRAGKANLLKYFNEFPEVRFSKSAYRFVARTYAKGAESHEANVFFDRALRDYPESTQLKKLFLEYCVNTKTQMNKGINLAREMSRQREGSDASVTHLYAALHVLRGDTLEALRVYGPKFIENFSNDADALYDYASFWAGQCVNLQSALLAGQKAVSLFGVHSHWNTLALLYWELGEYGAAVEAQKHAIDLARGIIPEYKERLKCFKRRE